MAAQWESIIPSAVDMKKDAEAAAKKAKKAEMARAVKKNASMGVRKMVADSFLVPPDRAVMTPQWDISEDFLGTLGKSDSEAIYQRVNRLIEATAQFDFLTLRRRVKRNFQFFALAGTAKTIPKRLDQPPETCEELDERELDFVEDFYNLLLAAHYTVISRGEWETAQDENFTFNSPVDVNWNAMENTLLKRFWAKHRAQRRRAAPISDRILLFHRGIYTVTARGMFIVDKIDLLVQYLVLDPLGWLYGKCTKKEGKVDITLLLQQSVSGPGDEVLDEDDDQASRDAAAKEDASYNQSLRHTNAQVVRRVSLQQLMPTVGAVLKNVTKEMEIQEPTYKDVVVLYRRTVPDKPVKKSDRDPVIACDKDVARRNIHVKRFSDIPMADVEMVFPEKKIWLKPIMFIQLAATLIAGLIAGIVSFRSGEALTLSLCITAITLVYGRYSQVMASAQMARQQVQDTIVERMYEQTQDSQESDVNALLDEIAEQHIKETMLAYYTLLALARPMTKEELDAECETYLEKRFGEKVDFAIECSLPGLLADGLIQQAGEGQLTAVPLPEAYRILAGKWAGAFERDEDSISVPGVTLAASRAKNPVGKAMGKVAGGVDSFSRGLESVGTSMVNLVPSFGFTSSRPGAGGGSAALGPDALGGAASPPPMPSVSRETPQVAVRPPMSSSSAPTASQFSPAPRQRKRDMFKNLLGGKSKET